MPPPPGSSPVSVPPLEGATLYTPCSRRVASRFSCLLLSSPVARARSRTPFTWVPILKVSALSAPWSGTMPHEKMGQVVQLHVLAVENQLFDARHHVGQHAANHAGREGGVVVGHVLGQGFDVEGFVYYGTGVPFVLGAFQTRFQLILFVENHEFRFF